MGRPNSKKAIVGISLSCLLQGISPLAVRQVICLAIPPIHSPDMFNKTNEFQPHIMK